MKIDIITSFDEHELNIESCSELIKMLEESYKTIREEFYIKFFDIKHLKKALIVCLILICLYFLSEEIIFIYALPFTIILFMIVSIIFAEYLTKKTRVVINEEILKLIKRKEYLLKQQNDIT